MYKKTKKVSNKFYDIYGLDQKGKISVVLLNFVTQSFIIKKNIRLKE